MAARRGPQGRAGTLNAGGERRTVWVNRSVDRGPLGVETTSSVRAVERPESVSTRRTIGATQGPFIAGTAIPRCVQEAAVRLGNIAALWQGGHTRSASPELRDLTVCPIGRSVNQISVCSEISNASSTSMPRYLTVDSSLWTEVHRLDYLPCRPMSRQAVSAAVITVRRALSRT